LNNVGVNGNPGEKVRLLGRENGITGNRERIMQDQNGVKSSMGKLAVKRRPCTGGEDTMIGKCTVRPVGARGTEG